MPSLFLLTVLICLCQPCHMHGDLYYGAGYPSSGFRIKNSCLWHLPPRPWPLLLSKLAAGTHHNLKWLQFYHPNFWLVFQFCWPCSLDASSADCFMFSCPSAPTASLPSTPSFISIFSNQLPKFSGLWLVFVHAWKAPTVDELNFAYLRAMSACAARKGNLTRLHFDTSMLSGSPHCLQFYHGSHRLALSLTPTINLNFSHTL